MPTPAGEPALGADELRTVVGFALADAEQVLPLFERRRPDDPRPRAALEAARRFVDGEPRSQLQRTAAVAAHRAARETDDEAAEHAARAAGDAAAAAYLHPLAHATQVGHLLRASAGAARAAELDAGDVPAVGEAWLAASAARATPLLVEVLRRYPPALAGRTRVARLMARLDATLRARPTDR